LSASALPGRVRRASACLALLFAGAALTACSGLDGEQAKLCRAAVPAVEPTGTIHVDAVATDPAMPHGVRVDYTVTEPFSPPRRGFARCAFGGGRLDTDRLKLLGVETAAGDMPPVRLLFLERFWLSEPDAIAEGEERLTGLTGNQPLIETPLPGRSGYWLQQVLNGLPISAFYAFLAVGYALVYGLVNRINLAFGEIAMVGAYAAVATVISFGGLLTGGAGVAVAIAVAVALSTAFLHGSILGATLGEAVFQPLSRASHRSFLIATIGLSIALMEGLRLIAGSRDRWIQPILNDPVVIAGGAFEVTMTTMQMVEVAGAATLLAWLLVRMRRSPFGRAWRAVSDDPLMARLIGIDTGRVATVTFALSTGLAGLAGAMSALHYGQASYGAGTMVGLKALVAALIGGIGSLPGAAVGGLVIGLGETLWSAAMPVEWRDTAVLAALAVLLIFRPEGLFGIGRPAADSGDARWASHG
jgi:branched-chain amino acid transport system permease protein